ncbi:MAG: 30S ribosomal protein S4 [Anaerolineales bacterium]|nr:30S ribosomal protein S4 [Anaerolineales bacterium]
MARYTGSVCRLCRRQGIKLFLKGERCFSDKCAVTRRSYPPGMHGQKARFRRQESDYALQLREKQRARRTYGVFEQQFRRYYREALRRPGRTGVNLLTILESRLDNVVYRLGWADSRTQARQLVRHGHVMLNGRKTNVPSALVKPGDAVSVRPESQRMTYFKDLAEIMEQKSVPEWLSRDVRNLSGKVLNLAERKDIDLDIKEQLIVEFYSR